MYAKYMRLTCRLATSLLLCCRREDSLLDTCWLLCWTIWLLVEMLLLLLCCLTTVWLKDCWLLCC